jgi:hypothetical protein
MYKRQKYKVFLYIPGHRLLDRCRKRETWILFHLKTSSKGEHLPKDVEIARTSKTSFRRLKNVEIRRRTSTLFRRSRCRRFYWRLGQTLLLTKDLQ